MYESPVLDSLVASENSNKENDSANNLSCLDTGFHNQKDRPYTKVVNLSSAEAQCIRVCCYNVEFYSINLNLCTFV